MAQTVRTYTGDGTSVVFPVDFTLGYIRKEHVYVYEGDDYNNQLTFTWINDSQVQLATPVANGVQFKVRRIVPRDSIVNDYQNNAIMHESNIDNSFKQALMILEEVQDGYTDPDGANVVTGDLDLQNNRVVNLADPIADGDAVSLLFLRGFVLDEQNGLDLVRRAEAAAENAEDSFERSNVIYTDFSDKYQGSGVTFPTPRQEGSLFYYSGTSYTQGLYIHFASNADPETGTWDLVSGEGPQGPQGPQGVQGAAGEKGEQGIVGPTGDQGPQGIQGAIGNTGPAGIKGETGAQGPQGPQGVVGPKGAVGPDGPQGIQGNTGQTGAQGIEGPQGDQGDLGPQGPTGPTGPQGIKGEQGIVGPVGPKGDQGPQGVQGIQGPTGSQGDTGADGQSFQIDAIGTLAERAAYDSEATDFKYYATDYSVSADEDPEFTRFVGDGNVTAYVLPFTPDGPQSVAVYVGGVAQGPDKYTVTVVSDIYTLTFTTAPDLGANILVREFSISTGYGAIYIKNSATAGDWSSPIPFGKGPRGGQGPQGVQGPVGVQGPIGNAGPQGPVGVQGPQGPVGPQGATGDVGPQGSKGETGDQGPQGIVGPQGATGAQGSIGPQGPTGDQGATGLTGPQGAQGDIGPQGQQGATGDRGPTGVQGAQGDRGPTGNQGPQGNTGAKGPQGAQGPTGAQGPKGNTGATGPTGSQGPTGAKGPTGNQGIRGSRSYYLGNRTSWSVTSAVGQIGVPLRYDVSTQYNTTLGFSESRVFVGGNYNVASNWNVVDKTENFIKVVSGGVPAAGDDSGAQGELVTLYNVGYAQGQKEVTVNLPAGYENGKFEFLLVGEDVSEWYSATARSPALIRSGERLIIALGSGSEYQMNYLGNNSWRCHLASSGARWATIQVRKT